MYELKWFRGATLTYLNYLHNLFEMDAAMVLKVIYHRTNLGYYLLNARNKGVADVDLNPDYHLTFACVPPLVAGVESFDPEAQHGSVRRARYA